MSTERREITVCAPVAPEIREVGDEMPLLSGHFAVFNTPTTINSREGHFIERIAPGAFKKTFAEGRDNMKVLFQHGRDPQIGDKVLGTIEELSEDDTGASYSVRMFDTSYNRDLLPALRAGEYGASFRFQVMEEDYDPRPERSAQNPDGIPERVVRQAKVLEFGPVTFPAYAEATALVRMNDEWQSFDSFTSAADIFRDTEKLEWIRAVLERSIPTEPADEVVEEVEVVEEPVVKTLTYRSTEPVLGLNGRVVYNGQLEVERDGLSGLV